MFINVFYWVKINLFILEKHVFLCVLFWKTVHFKQLYQKIIIIANCVKSLQLLLLKTFLLMLSCEISKYVPRKRIRGKQLENN